MNKPTTEQETQYAAMLAAGIDPDLAAYMANIDDCNCVLPEQSCRMCRGAAKESAMSLEELLSMPSAVVITALGDQITVAATPEAHARVVDCYRGLQALVDAGRYREYSVHIGGRTTEFGVAEPIEGAATGPTFVLNPGRKWQAVPE